MQHQGFETAADARTFIFGGKAIFTITSAKTGKHFTFKASENGRDPMMTFVGVLSGQDNNSDYQYIGFIKRGNGTDAPGRGKLIAGRKGHPDAPSFKALQWVLGHLDNDNLPEDLTIQHEGRCCRCNRKLTRPESISAGIGPECAGKM